MSAIENFYSLFINVQLLKKNIKIIYRLLKLCTTFILFQISKIEDGKRSISSIKGYRRDSEVIFNSTMDNSRRGRLDGVFSENDSSDTSSNPGNLTRSVSQPDFIQELNNNNTNNNTETNTSSIHEPSSIFVRPGMGSLAFR